MKTTHLRPASSVRVRLAPSGDGPRLIDGAWWPRTGDLAIELPALLRALPRQWSEITRVTVSGPMWGVLPARIRIGDGEDQVVRPRRTSSGAGTGASTVCLLAPGRGRWDLLVVPPETDEDEAARLMATAGAADVPGFPGVVDGRGILEVAGVPAADRLTAAGGGR